MLNSRSQFISATFVTIVGLFVAAGAVSVVEGAPIKRGFETATRVFHSDSLPSLNLPVPETFDYLGRLEFGLFGVAHVDRHIFADIRNDTIQKILILQFEGFMDSVQGEYSFNIPSKADEIAGSNYRFSPKVAGWSGHKYKYVHNTWAFDHDASARERPEAEAGRMLKFLDEKGLELAAGLIMSRYATAIGTGKRHELILFYMEPLSAHGHKLADFPDGGQPTKAYDKLHELIVDRSHEIFGKLRD